MTNSVDGNFRVLSPRDARDFSGEQPDEIDDRAELELIHQYCLARDLCAGLDVLIVNSGDGRGPAILAGVARSVVGLNCDEAAVARAREAFQFPGLRFLRGGVAEWPVENACMDVVVSFASLAHVQKDERFSAEARRVLRPGGLLIVGAPDLVACGRRPEEFSHTGAPADQEFENWLHAHFRHVALLRQRVLFGSLIASTEITGPWRSYERRASEYIEAGGGWAHLPHRIGVASDAELPRLPSSIYVDRHSVEEVAGGFNQSQVLASQMDERERTVYLRTLLEGERRVRERDTALGASYAARAEMEALARQIDERRVQLAWALDRATRRPWMSAKALAYYGVLKSLAAATALFAPRASARFASSAKKRSPRRYEALLGATPIAPSPARIDLASAPCVQPLPSGDVQKWLSPGVANDVGSAVVPAPVDDTAAARRILVVGARLARPNHSSAEQTTIGVLEDFCALGYEVTYISLDMAVSAQNDAGLRAIGVNLIDNLNEYGFCGEYIARQGHRFGAFYLIGRNVAELVAPIVRVVAPKARIIYHAPNLRDLQPPRKSTPNRKGLAETAAIRDSDDAVLQVVDHIALVSETGAIDPQCVLPDVSISLIPAHYAPAPQPLPFSARRDIFFLGDFRQRAHVDSVLWFAAEVFPILRRTLPDVSFNIFGPGMPAEIAVLGQSAGIAAIGQVLDLTPVLDHFRVAVAPARIELEPEPGEPGFGAVLDAGLPCVCSAAAAASLGVDDGVHCRVADDPDDFAAAIVTLYTDEALWRRIYSNALTRARQEIGVGVSRAAILAALDAARALPLPLYIEHCQNSPPLAPPSVDPEIPPDVSVIVPVYNKWALTRACINSVVLTSAGCGVNYEIILADDGSSDETVGAAEIFPGLRVVRTPVNLGFLRNCNHAAGHARGRYLLLLNNDTIVLPGWLKALYRAMESDPEIAIAGSKLLYPDGVVQEAGAALFRDGTATNVGRGRERDAPIVNFPREADYISGASILIRTDFWEKVGGFDEAYKNAYCEDSDLAMRARAEGFYVSYQPGSEVIHFEHQSYLEQAPSHNSALQSHNIAILLAKWQDVFTRDHVEPGEWQIAANKAERRIPASARARRQRGALNILYFSPLPAYAALAASAGGPARILDLGRRIQSLGHKVHFVLPRSDELDDAAQQAMRKAWDSVEIFDAFELARCGDGRGRFDGCYQDGVGEAVRLSCIRNDIDVVLCASLFMSKILEFVPSYIVTVIDARDRIDGCYESPSAREPNRALFSCPPAEEGAYLRRADHVLVANREEADACDALSGRRSAISVPLIGAPRFIDRKFDKLTNIGFVLDAERRDGARATALLTALAQEFGGACPFTAHVALWSGDGTEPAPLEQSFAFEAPWLRLHGKVADLGDFYRRMDLIAPLAATQDAVMTEAMALGLPLLAPDLHVGRTGPKLDVEALARDIRTLAGWPTELQRLADDSRDRYLSLYLQATGALDTFLAHWKSTGEA